MSRSHLGLGIIRVVYNPVRDSTHCVSCMCCVVYHVAMRDDVCTGELYDPSLSPVH